MESGTRFGSYEVRETIGSGGMGNVYRATDTELKRDVAVKVLREWLAGDAELIARFRREAEVLASLNHPNIAQIFGLEKVDGGIVIVMELVDGPTLAERIAKGPVPPDEALGIARQIADALEGAHGRQIVHRDLKPANVKLRADGTVKVLDFGIAKSIDVRAASGGRTPVETTPAMTETGVILGTAAYMSPEQARGKPVDQRTDIWAFGCLLFEMLTGRPAFGGEDVMLTLAHVVDRDTDLSSMPGTLAPAVRQAIKLCLEKDLRRRIADIRDVRLALDGAFEPVSRDAAQPGDAPFWRRPGPVAAAALALGALAFGAAWERFAPAPPEPRPLRLRVALPGGADLAFAAQGHSLRLSPDGRRLAFTARRHARPEEPTRLWIWPLDSLDATAVPGAEGAFQPFWSPDGRSIGFIAGRELKRVAAGGGPVQRLGGVGIAASGAWSPADVIVFTDPERGLSSIPAGGGEPRGVTRLPAESDEFSHDELPFFLPDGRHFLYFRHLSDASMSGIYVGSIDLLPAQQTGVPLVLADDGPLFVARAGSARGYVLFQREQTLYAQAFDAAALALAGDAVPVEAGLFAVGGVIQGWRLFTASAEGDLLVYQPSSTATDSTELVWVDHEGRETPVGLEPGRYTDFAVSPDGAGIAVVRGPPNLTEMTVWVWSPAARTLTPIDRGSSAQLNPYWTDDGERIVYYDLAAGALVSRRADGVGEIERLLAQFAGAFDEAADGTLLLTVQSEAAGAGVDIGLLPSTGEREISRVLATQYNEAYPDLSPDGRWLAYSSDESGRLEIYVRPFPDVETRRWQVSTDGGQFPQWAPDGGALYFLGPSQMLRAAVEAAPTFSWRRPEVLFEHGAYLMTAGLLPIGYELAADGQRFLFLKSAAAAGPSSAAAPELVVVQSWLDELERRLAAD